MKFPFFGTPKVPRYDTLTRAQNNKMITAVDNVPRKFAHESDSSVVLSKTQNETKQFNLKNPQFISQRKKKINNETSTEIINIVDAVSDTSDASTGTDEPSKEEIKPEDVMAQVVGDFGRWQLVISILMSLLKLSNAWYQLNIIFMAPQQQFWCKRPPQFAKYSIAKWRDMSTPTTEEFPCLIFDPEVLAISPDLERNLIPLVPCKSFDFDTSVFKRTIVSDWNLVCDQHYKAHLTQCVMMTGVLVGGVFFGILADKYGRRMPLMFAIMIQAITSFIASIITWYWVFLINWFLLALACGGITITSFVLCMEAVSGKWRMIITVLYQLPFGLGNTVMALLAYWLRDWRKLEFGLACLSSLYILYWFWILESPRWLMATDRTEEAVDILYHAAKINKREWTKDQIRALMPKHTVVSNGPGFFSLMKYKNMRNKTVLLSLNWLFTGIAFYTFSQFIGDIGKNIFLTVALTGFLSTPGPIACVFVILSTGRKNTVWIFQFLTAMCFVALLLTPADTFPHDWPSILFAGIGFAAMAAYVPTLYLYSGELYPTLGRNRGVGGVTTFARIGSMIAPFIISLHSEIPNIPLVILAVMSFAQMVLLVPLPETKGEPLPDTIEQAELITKQRQRMRRNSS